MTPLLLSWGIFLSEDLICDAAHPQDRRGKRLCLQEDLEGPFKACSRGFLLPSFVYLGLTSRIKALCPLPFLSDLLPIVPQSS